MTGIAAEHELVSLDKRRYRRSLCFGIRLLRVGCPQGLRRLRFSFFLFTCQRTRWETPSFGAGHPPPSLTSPIPAGAGLVGRRVFTLASTRKSLSPKRSGLLVHGRENRGHPGAACGKHRPRVRRYICGGSQNCQHRKMDSSISFLRRRAAPAWPHLCPIHRAHWAPRGDSALV